MKKRIQLLAVASIAVSLIPAAVRGEGTFTLSLAPNGSPFQMGKAGEAVSFSCQAFLEHAGAGNGAGAWSLGIAVEGATIASVTTGGTHAGGYRDPAGSIEKVHIIDPEENGGVTGVVSSVVLSTQGLETAVLPAQQAWSILSVTVDATIPEGGGAARFELRDGLIAAGEAFPISVTQDGTPVIPAVLPLEVPLEDTSDCCESSLRVGFSEAVIRDGPVFGGIAGVGEGCFAEGGEIISEAPLGAVNSTTVHVNVISNLPDTGIQGWSFGVAVDGSAVVNSITTAGTAGDSIPNGGYRDPETALGRSDVINPARNGGQMGVVASLALTTGGNPASVLPSVGTETILKIDISAAERQGDADQTATLRFQEGLVGVGGPVQFVMTVEGNTAPVCNVDRASVTVVFRKRPDAPFRRGDANKDGGVNISDAIWILNALFTGGPQTQCNDSADVNDSGAADISDPVYLSSFLFFGTALTPPSPGHTECGPDPTEDALDCIASSCP
jgi:hypothetical protein